MPITKVAALSIALSITAVLGFEPLVNKRFAYTALPYKVDTDVGLPRGEQIGYNICNSTTEGPQSLCQTLIINSLDDFCIWAPSVPGETVGQIEGEMVAWCTKGGHGTRVMPAGTITGVQLTRTPDYIQVVGFMNQTLIDMVAGDQGGEMDPHGADLRGNPMGGVVYTQAFADNGTYTQVVEWHNFNGGNTFCLKACDPSGSNDAGLCQHIYDTQGCGFNAPSNARDGVFESCAGNSQAPPGQGVAVPASSSCSTFASTDIYGGGVTVRVPGATFTPATTATPTTTSTSGAGGTTSTSNASGTKSGSGAAPSRTASGAGKMVGGAGKNVVLASMGAALLMGFLL
ncbi:macrophage activating glycoprotein [Pholiota molesta]|nr:macrophage activating glycoprotein [Pholiota molesta]